MTQNPEAPVHRQPWLHELAICVDGNTTALSATSGDMRPATAEGLYVDDAPGAEPAHGRRLRGVAVPGGPGGERRQRGVLLLCPQPGQPRCRPDRRGAPRRGGCRAPPDRGPGGLARPEPVAAQVVVELAGRRGADIGAVKSGHVSHAAAAPALRGDDGLLPAGAARHAPSGSAHPRTGSPPADGRVRAAFALTVDPGTSAVGHADRPRSSGRRPRPGRRRRLGRRRLVRRCRSRRTDPRLADRSPPRSPTCSTCCCATRTTAPTCSPGPERLGTSRCSAVTRSGRRG